MVCVAYISQFVHLDRFNRLLAYILFINITFSYGIFALLHYLGAYIFSKKREKLWISFNDAKITLKISMRVH